MENIADAPEIHVKRWGRIVIVGLPRVREAGVYERNSRLEQLVKSKIDQSYRIVNLSLLKEN
jgi:hypothetical protein